MFSTPALFIAHLRRKISKNTRRATPAPLPSGGLLPHHIKPIATPANGIVRPQRRNGFANHRAGLDQPLVIVATRVFEQLVNIILTDPFPDDDIFVISL